MSTQKSARLASAVHFAAASVVLGVSASAGFSQNVEQTVPKPPPMAAPAKLPTVPRPTTEPAESPIITSLSGLRIVSDAASTDKTSTTGIIIESPLIASRRELVDSLTRRLGKPLSMKDLDVICSEVVEACRRAGRPVVDAVVPEQEITGGSLRIVLIEAQRGDVSVEGVNRPAAQQRLRDAIRIPAAAPIDSPTLLEDLDWINRCSPFRTVDLVFARGANPKQTDLILRSSESRYPLRIFGEYENSGSETTGENRYIAGFNWGDAMWLGRDHQLNYQFTTADDVDRFQAHGLSYVAPLSWRHVLSVFGSWSRSRPELSDPRLESTGESWQVSGRYEIPLRRLLYPRDRVRRAIELGFDFKRSNNNLDFGGQSVFSRSADTVQFSAAYSFETSTNASSTRGKVMLVASPGNLSSGNDSESFAQARSTADPTYLYLNAMLHKQFTLPSQWVFSTKLAGQVSTDALLSSEQFGVGGADTVRGFPERSLNGDGGALLSLELISPPVSLARVLGKKWSDELHFYAFSDFGMIWNYDGSSTNPSHAHALGVGPGLRYNLGSNVAVDVSYGFRVDDRHVDDGEIGRHQIHIVGSISW